jgi:hypothetical protein
MPGIYLVTAKHTAYTNCSMQSFYTMKWYKMSSVLHAGRKGVGHLNFQI